MSTMTLEESLDATSKAISEHILGFKGINIRKASIKNILEVIENGPKTQEAIQRLVIEVANEYTVDRSIISWIKEKWHLFQMMMHGKRSIQ